MSKAHPPELKKFMDKKLGLEINCGRRLVGILRGYDPFMNLVVDECVERFKNGETRKVLKFCMSDCLSDLAKQKIGCCTFCTDHLFKCVLASLQEGVSVRLEVTHELETCCENATYV